MAEVGHSSGGFGGGRSSGGFSGGGRSSGGGSFGGFSGGYHSRPNYGPPPPRHHHHFYYGGNYYGGPPRRTTLIDVILAIVIIIIFFAIFSQSMKSETDIPQSTKERTALSGVVSKTDWYSDKIGWVSNKSNLISGLEHFYNKTGVQPFILFVPYDSKYWNGNEINPTTTKNYLESVYASNFKDEGHFIFAYFQCSNDSKSEMDGEFKYLSGYSVDSIMDDEALRIFKGYFDTNYYNTSLTMETMISNTFKQTADSIMQKATNGWDFAKVLAIAIGVVIVVVVIYFIIKNKNQREKEKEKYTEEILNKPLDTFGDDTSDLEKKYDDK